MEEKIKTKIANLKARAEGTDFEAEADVCNKLIAQLREKYGVQYQANFDTSLVLDPLSKATATALRPPRFAQTDHLFIWLDKKKENFIVEARYCYQKNKGLLCERLAEQEYRSPSWQTRDFFNRILERTPSPNPSHPNRWICAPTDYFALIVHHCWPEDRIHFKAALDLPESEDAKLLYTYLLQRFFSQTERAEMAAEFKITNETPKTPSGWVEHPELPQSDYQTTATMFSLDQEATALFMEQGTGKTNCVIQRICMEAIRLRSDGTKLPERNGKVRKGRKQGMYRALIVCPPAVCLNWQTEIERFAVCPGKVVVCRGTALQRLKDLTEGITSEDDCLFSAVIIPYDSLTNSIKAFRKVKWNLVVSDESHWFKSNRTKRWTEAMRVIRESADQRMVLTGTPIGNSPLDLWTQLEFLGEGLSGMRSFGRFRKLIGKWEEVGGQSGVEKLVGLQNTALLQERLSRLSFQITKEEAGLKLPEKVYDVYEVGMTKEQEEIYEAVANSLYAEIEDKLSGETNQLTVNHILTSLLRLAQITSGYVTWDAEIDPRTGTELRPSRIERISYLKIDACVELLRETLSDPKAKAIIWSNQVPNIHALHQRLSEEGIGHVLYYGGTSKDKKEEAVQSFNCNPSCRVLIGNPASAGVGLNLIGYDQDNQEESDTYCAHEIFFAQGWSFLERGQAEDRSHRRGTRMPVRITDLVVPNTIDEEIRRRVRDKKRMAETTLDIREILQGIMGE